MNIKKTIISFMLISAVLCAFICNIYADEPKKPTYDSSTISNKLKTQLTTTWATIAYTIQIICVGCIVFAGVRYMFASSDTKADIKKSLTYLIIGSVIVFGAVWIMQLIDNASDTVLK